MTPYELLIDVHALEEELLAFERKYGIRSETFYIAYVNGEEPEDESWVLDFGEWASVYKTWLERQAEYRNAIQHLQRQPQIAPETTNRSQLDIDGVALDLSKEEIVEFVHNKYS